MKKRRLGLILASSIVVSSLLQNSLCTHAQNTVAETVKSLEGESVYQIMVDRFYDGDPSNNAKGEAFRYTENNQDDFRYMHGGDWQGVIDKIPYIKGMGYTAIWISPVADPQLWGMPDANGKQWPTAYHGYNVYDPNRANRYFGTDDPIQSKKKLKELVDECHKNGMKVILDGVFNHTGSDSKYFNEKGTFPDKGACQDIMSLYGSFFKKSYGDDGRLYFHHWWGMPTLPRCDSYSKTWQDYIYGEGGIVDRWFKMGIDGLRLDVADELSDEFIEGIRKAVSRHKKDGLIIGEVWKNAMRMNREYISSGKAMDSHMNYR